MSATQADRPIDHARTQSTVTVLTDQLPRERGVDYDEHGAEMDPNARVWRVYVDETDKADKELVDGWNSAMDVMLVFAAVFSAILTAFVIESSKDLKPDYSEISARALLAISNTQISSGATPIQSGTGALQTDPLEFIPTRSAVVVNTLWFLSLGLSIAVTLVSILAKEWCYSFMTRRTGAKLSQGRLRQKRWDGIRRWRMEGIISTLPLLILMHTSLLLFAIGLSVYLWNINPNVALPVVITTLLTVLYYVVTAILPLFFKYCPYTTAIFKLFYPLWAALFKSRSSRALFQFLVMAPALLLVRILNFKKRIFGKTWVRYGEQGTGSDAESRTTDSTNPTTSTDIIRNWVNNFEKKFHHRVEEIHKGFLVDSSHTGEDETPMDEATSAMLLWMITNCEDPKSVDLALKAIAGADLWLPCQLFLEVGTDAQVFRKLEHCLYALENTHLRSHKSTREELLNNAYLYSRALAALIRTRGDPPEVPATTVSWEQWDTCMTKLNDVSKSYLKDATQKFSGTSLEFGALLLEGSPSMFQSNSEFYTNQCNEKWELIQQISSNEVTGVPPSSASVRALVNVITRTLLYTEILPLPLVALFNAYEITPGNEDATLGHAIGIALTVSRFTNPRYVHVPPAPESQETPPRQGTSASSALTLSRSAHGQIVFNKLSKKQPTQRRTRALLTFGLLGLLDLPETGNFLGEADIKSIRKALQTLETAPVDSKDPTILTHEDRYLRYLGYHKLMPRTYAAFDLEAQFTTTVKRWLEIWEEPASRPNRGHEKNSRSDPDESIVFMHLEVLLSPTRCKLFGSEIVDELTAIIFPPEDPKDDPQSPASKTSPSNKFKAPLPFDPKRDLSLAAKKLRLRSIAYSVTHWDDCSRRQTHELQTILTKLVEAGFHSSVVSLLNNPATEGDSELAPYAMLFLWKFISSLIKVFHPRENTTFPSYLYYQGTRPVESSPQNLASGWKCIRDVGFEGDWLAKLRGCCEKHPQSVLDSGILDELSSGCKDECYRARGNENVPTVDAIKSQGLVTPNEMAENASITWPQIYKRLKAICETSVPPEEPVRTESPSPERVEDLNMIEEVPKGEGI